MNPANRKLALPGVILLSIVAAVALGKMTSTAKQTEQDIFATDALALAYETKSPALRMLPATDGVLLAYYPFAADRPVAKLVFYHGGGAHSLAGYQYLADSLSRKYRISTYLVDIRGHGQSGGDRGDAPSREQVWRDVSTVLTAIESEMPQAPTFLGAHSSGAGLLLNFLTGPGAESVHGLVLIAPEFGYRARVKRETRDQFARVNYLAFLVHGITGGRLCGHCEAVDFDYAEETRTKAGLLSAYTVNMSKAVTPHDPENQLRRLKGRLGVWVGTQDELFDALKLRQFILAAAGADLAVDFYAVGQATHLSILVLVDAAIAQWIGAVAESPTG